MPNYGTSNELRKYVRDKIFKDGRFVDKPKLPQTVAEADNTNVKKMKVDDDKKKVKKKDTQPPKTNVFDTINEKSPPKKSRSGFGVFTGNATDLRREDELKVNKKYQDRVNKVLGR